MSQNNIFEKFTNKYSLSKTLRFELRPVGNTQKMLEDSGVVMVDKERKERYEKTKPFFDRLHQEFINDSLSGAKLVSLDGYEAAYKDWKSDRKNKDFQEILKRKEKALREEIVGLFDHKAQEWVLKLGDGVKIKKQNHEFLFESSIFGLLEQKYGDDPESKIDTKSIFASWDKWAAYFGKFFETRKNFYKSDGTATAVATRVVNDNLRRFCDNIELYNSTRSKVDLSGLEKDFGSAVGDMFQLDNYGECLNQSGIDLYNGLIGGRSLPAGGKTKGINEYLNEHRQKTGEKLPRFKKLDKQIGSDKEAFVAFIENDEELLEQLRAFVVSTKEKITILDLCFEQLPNKNTNLSRVFINKVGLNTILRRWFVNNDKIPSALVDVLNQAGDKSAKFDKKSEEYKLPDFVSLQSLADTIDQLSAVGESPWKGYYLEEIKSFPATSRDQLCAVLLFEYKQLLETGHEEGKRLSVLWADLEEVLARTEFRQSDEVTSVIKSYSDRVLNVYRFAKYFSLEKSRQWNPDGLELDDFYVSYEEYYSDAYEKVVKMYDKIRNYMTKKPFNQNKWKLNFEHRTLADGWDKNKESANASIILRKNDRYYLGIMARGNTSIFEKPDGLATGLDYEKLVYKQMADPKRDFPKGVFSKKGIETYVPSKEVLNIYEAKRFKTDSTEFSKSDLWTLVDFFKACIPLHPSWKLYRFDFSDTETYENLNDFYTEVSRSAYRIWFDKVSEEYIEKANQEEKLYLFEIHNKDWNLKDGAKKTGNKNAHTLYFEQVFSTENAQNNFVLKLNGKAELFFRPATDEVRLGSAIVNGKDVLKHRRYAQDKIFFHVPVTLNRNAPDARKFNQLVNELLAKNPNTNIIGLDRGEKHLVYLSVINQKGEILELKSLNTIKGVEYARLLEKRAKNRENARRDWKGVEQIKDLKRGYISHVVYEIADLIIKYNAIVVFEDLNMRFKQVRGGIEKSVYQQLEKALIDKLNFLVDKKQIDPEKAGHILQAYQLTAPFESFKDMGKQTGVVFYTQAEYTSQTDPVTGFRKNIYISNSATVEKIKEHVRRFDKIGWDEHEKSYYFTYNPINFVDRKFKDGTVSKEWTVYAKAPRIKREKKGGYWETVSVNLNDEFFKLFKLWGFGNCQGDIYEQIFQMFEEGGLEGRRVFDGKDRNFWQSFIYLFNLVMQVRNSTATQYKRDEKGDVIETIEGVDFIASPVAPFFCTDGGKYTEGYVNLADIEQRIIGDSAFKQKALEEFNGDANGAYNIARKGIIILNRIGENSEKPDLFITKKDWDGFVQR